jgi:tetratricopeptide (TPR) repeat protein
VGLSLYRYLVFFAALVAALSSSVRVQAQDDRARLHFQAGASYYEAGDYEDALREFQRSHALSQRSELFYNFSLCYQQIGDLDNAALYLRRYLDEVEAIDNRDQLERRHENLLERIAARGATPTPPNVGDPRPDPEAEPTPDQEPDTEPAADAEASPDEPRRGGGVPVGAVIGYAVAGVGVVLAATFGPLALRERGRIEDGCGADRSCTSGQVQRMDGFALGADIGLGVAVVGATVGTILLLTGRGSDDEEESTDQARLRFTPYASPVGAGASLRGSF